MKVLVKRKTVVAIVFIGLVALVKNVPLIVKNMNKKDLRDYEYQTFDDLFQELRTYRFFKRLKTEYKKHGWYMNLKEIIKIAWLKSK